MPDPLSLLIFFLIIVCLIALSWFAGSDAPYVPTTNPKLLEVFKLVKLKGKIFYELGSGDGRVVLKAAQMGADAIGIEQSWLRIWYSRYKAKKLGLKNTTFYHGNIFDRDYYAAEIVYIYLLPQGIEKLEKKLKKELGKGKIVITQTYHFKSWKPIKKMGNFWIYKQSLKI